MRNLIKTVLPLLSVFVAACAEEDKTIVVTEFPVEEKLDTLYSVTPAYAEHLTNSVNAAGDFLVGSNYKSPFCFSVFDSSLSLTDTIVRGGHGHDEMLSPSYFGQWRGRSENPEIIVYDQDSKQLAGLHIHPFEGVEPIANLTLADSINPSRIFVLDETSCVGINLPTSDQARLFKYDFKDRKAIFAHDGLKFSEEYKFYTSQCGMAVRDDHKQIVTPYVYFPLICLYDSDLNLHKRVFVGEEVVTESISMSDRYPGFVDAKYVGRNIAALLMDPDEDSTSKLLVFDAEGNPKASYSIGHSMGFCFDAKLGKLMSLEYDDTAGEMKFYVYDMPDALKN